MTAEFKAALMKWSCLAYVAACAVVGLTGCPAAKTEPAGTVAAATSAPGPAKPKAAAKLYTRAEFKALVMGKTAAEVRAAVGTPGRTFETGGDETWVYEGRTVDHITGKIDPAAMVVFEGGVVARVNY